MGRKALTFTVALAAALAVAAGCSQGSSDSGAAPPSGVPANSAQPSPSVSVAATPPAASPTPAQPGPTKPAQRGAPEPAQKLKAGMKGPQIVALQQRLTALGYWNGAKADGRFGETTRQAVYALQKAAGLDRDGTVGPKTKAALDAGVRPAARSKAGSGHQIEIDLTRQLLMIVDNGQVSTILNTSTGSNRNYEYEGETYLADTPAGHFKVGRQIDGQRNGPLGPLWRPKYFNGGIAVHGAPNVPPYPASHGCARVTDAAMNWIWSGNQIPLKSKVWVY
jgi:peptidoglycan hydrolase-like protein with peptidoglycan-binding domain